MTRRLPTPRPDPPEPLRLTEPATWLDWILAACAWALGIAVVIILLTQGWSCAPTPTPILPTPNSCETRVAVAMQTVDAAMATYVPLATICANCLQPTPTYMQTVTPRPTWTPAVTPAPLAECRPCTTASECPTGTTCYGYGGVLFCVDPRSLNGGYRKCLEQLYNLTYEGPPDEEIDLEALTTPMRERRGP